MAKRLAVLALIALVAVCVAAAQTGREEPLTNADIISIAKAAPLMRLRL
jgi:HAMP domain-containing protein